MGTESFHKTFKKEYVWPREFVDIREAKEAMLVAEDYNPAESTLP